MKRVYILHGCPSYFEKFLFPGKKASDKHWIPWTKRALVSLGVQVETPHMPHPWKPNYESFKEVFEKLKVDKDTILVGHSCGCAFLVRWLGETKREIKKLILVAPWKIAEGKRKDPFRKAFYEYPIDKTIKSRVKEIVMFTADDEGENGKKSLKLYHEALRGKIINLKGHGHYTRGDMGTEEFPELLEEIKAGLT